MDHYVIKSPVQLSFTGFIEHGSWLCMSIIGFVLRVNIWVGKKINKSCHNISDYFKLFQLFSFFPATRSFATYQIMSAVKNTGTENE